MMMEPTQMVLIFLITKPLFLLGVIWIVVWRNRHGMTPDMLPYRTSHGELPEPSPPEKGALHGRTLRELDP